MELKLYPTPGDFLRGNRTFLDKYEVSTQLNRGNAAAHADEPCRPDLLFGRVEQSGEPVLLFGNTLPYNLCMNAEPGDERAAEAAKELAGYLRESSIEIAGINARCDICEPFMEAFGGEFRLRAAMDIMVLENLIEPAPAPGAVRPAREDDLETIIQFELAFYREALNEDGDPEHIRSRNLERIEKGELRVFETPGREVASMAHTSRETEHGISISGVYTPPEHRGKGYCQNTVAALCRELLASGKRYCTLFVDKKNPISNRVYRKIGFEILEDCYDYRMK